MRQLSVSMMCVDFGSLFETLKMFERNHVDYLHIDVMDGHFVPNIMLGSSYVSWLRRNTNIPLDIHFMVENPNQMLDVFDIREGDNVIVHVESSWNMLDVVMKIKSRGGKAFIAVSPQTPVDAIRHLIEYIDGVLIMLVIPGFSGQHMINGMFEKIELLQQYKNDGFLVEVDGHVTEENIKQLEKAGADIFVAGTSLLKDDPMNYEERIKLFYNL